MPCIHYKDGCVWNGDMSELGLHLETCLFDLIDCPNKCGKKVANVSVEEHLNVFCTSMPRSCRHCGITTTGQDQVEHRNVCLKYPIPCPNDCDVGCLIRGEMDKHLNECELSVVCCSFKHLGCRYEGTQVRVEKHMKGFVEEHLLLVSGVVSDQVGQIAKLKNEKVMMNEQIEELISENKKLKEELTNQGKEQQNRITIQETAMENIKEELMGTVKKTETELRTDLCKIDKVLTQTIIDNYCYTWRISDFANKMKDAKEWTEATQESPQFYSHLNGYKLQGEAWLDGYGDNKGKYVSLYILQLKGDYDDGLMWPFELNIRFTIIDQNPDTKQTVNKLLDTAKQERARNYFKAPHSDGNAYGFTQFLLHTDLYEQQFLKDDTMIVQFTFLKRNR